MHCFKRVLFPILFYYCSSKCCNDCLCEYFIICTMLNHFLLHCIKLVETFPYCSIIVGSFRDIFFLKQQYIWRIIPKCHVNEVQAFKNQVTLICVSRCLQFYTRCNSYGHIAGVVIRHVTCCHTEIIRAHGIISPAHIMLTPDRPANEKS